MFAVAAAAMFSVGLVLGGKLGAAGIPPAWVMAVSRTIGVLLIALPLVLTGRLRLTRRALPLVAVAGVLEVLGGAVYVVAASDTIAVAAVLSSQFAAIAAVGGFVLFKERLQRLQVVGIALIAVGVTVLAASRRSWTGENVRMTEDLAIVRAQLIELIDAVGAHMPFDAAVASCRSRA